ncbi:hypothetical protein Tco_0952438 [Tanacetum coccineum]|uniref:Uncharacterized protein n=1 Tax=Tanacetum coccineum TaxID=301880 RepID=A0ABQ5DZW3_9ASTR
MVDAHLGTRLGDSIQKALWSYTTEFEKEAQAEKERYIDLIKKLVKDIINDEVKTQLPQILPKVVSDFDHEELYDGLVKSYKLDKDLFESYRKAYSIKRDREDKDKDVDPSAGSDQWMKRRKTRKEAESSKGSKSKDLKSTSSAKGTTCSQPKSSGKSAQAEDPIHTVDDTRVQQNQGQDMGKEYPFDLSKPLPLIMDRGRQVVPVDYFINNDLAYLRGGSSSKKYTTSTTKKEAAKYDIPCIEDMVPSLWSPIKIEVRREDQQLYKFKEGDFLKLHLHDIEDMLLLLVQKKLYNLERKVIFDLGVALLMFTRRIVETDIQEKDKIEAKITKPSTRTERP